MNVHVNIFVNVVDLHGKSITVVQQPGLDIFEPQQEAKCCIPLLTEGGMASKSWPPAKCALSPKYRTRVCKLKTMAQLEAQRPY